MGEGCYNMKVSDYNLFFDDMIILSIYIRNEM